MGFFSSCFSFYSWFLLIEFWRGVKVALTSTVSRRRNPASAWGAVIVSGPFALTFLLSFPLALSLLLNNPNVSKNPKPFQKQYPGFLRVLGKAGSCGLSEAEAIHRKALISSSSPNPSGSILENEILK